MDQIGASMKNRFNTVRPSCKTQTDTAKNQNFIIPNKMRARTNFRRKR